MILLLLYKPTKKGKRFHIRKCHVTMSEKGRNLFLWKCHVTMTKKHAYISNEMRLQNHSLTFIHKKITSFSYHILSRSPMAYNTTASLDKLTCTDYVYFGKCQDIFGQFFWYKNDSNYLDIELKVLKKDDNKEFLLFQNLTMTEAESNQFMRLRHQLVIASNNFARDENLTPVLVPTMSKDMDEQIKLALKVVEVVDRANKKKLSDSAVVKRGQAWEFLCSRPNICKEEGGREVSTSCLCEIKTYLFTWCNQFCIW